MWQRFIAVFIAPVLAAVPAPIHATEAEPALSRGGSKAKLALKPDKKRFRAAEATARIMKAVKIRFRKDRAVVDAPRRYQTTSRRNDLRLIEFE